MIQIFRQGENGVLIASKAKWDEQLKGLIELERRCLTLREEVEHLSERQEVLTGLMVSKNEHAVDSTRKVSGEDLRGVQAGWSNRGQKKLWRSHKRSTS